MRLVSGPLKSNQGSTCRIHPCRSPKRAKSLPPIHVERRPSAYPRRNVQVVDDDDVGFRDRSPAPHASDPPSSVLLFPNPVSRWKHSEPGIEADQQRVSHLWCNTAPRFGEHPHHNEETSERVCYNPLEQTVETQRRRGARPSPLRLRVAREAGVVSGRASARADESAAPLSVRNERGGAGGGALREAGAVELSLTTESDSGAHHQPRAHWRIR